MQPASHRESHTRPDSAQTRHTTSVAVTAAKFHRAAGLRALLTREDTTTIRAEALPTCPDPPACRDHSTIIVIPSQAQWYPC